MLDYAKVKLKSCLGVEKFETKRSSTGQLNSSAQGELGAWISGPW